MAKTLSVRLRRLADAEAQGSTAAGALGVNAALLSFYKRHEAKKSQSQDGSKSSDGMRFAQRELAKCK